GGREPSETVALGLTGGRPHVVVVVVVVVAAAPRGEGEPSPVASGDHRLLDDPEKPQQPAAGAVVFVRIGDHELHGRSHQREPPSSPSRAAFVVVSLFVGALLLLLVFPREEHFCGRSCHGEQLRLVD
ncbi:unnamed protein product, partial [Ectocarpus sp. 13 AM-2016]